MSGRMDKWRDGGCMGRWMGGKASEIEEMVMGGRVGRGKGGGWKGGGGRMVGGRVMGRKVVGGRVVGGRVVGGIVVGGKDALSKILEGLGKNINNKKQKNNNNI